MKECKIEGCSKPAKARGWCQMHYVRWLKHGSPHVTLQDKGEKYDGPCVIDGCEKPAKAKRMCSMHYQRWTRALSAAKGEAINTEHASPKPTYEQWARCICELNHEPQSTPRIGALISQARAIHKRYPASFAGDTSGDC